MNRISKSIVRLIILLKISDDDIMSETTNYIKSNDDNEGMINQLYRSKLTFAKNPEILDTYLDYSRFLVRNNFIKIADDGSVIIKGRRYDVALAYNTVDFKNKIVCEVGARDGLCGSYLTSIADKVYVSDYFKEWGYGTIHDLGQLDFWSFIWKQAAPCSEKIVCEYQNVLHLSYSDEMFDVVIATHVINYLNMQFLDGDIMGMKELVRICKPGGYIMISLIVGPIHESCQGTYVYSNETLFERVINPSGCELLNKTYDFDLSNKYNDGLFSLDDITSVSDVFLVLKKLIK